MVKITVHYFTVFYIHKGESVQQPRPATLAGIEAITNSGHPSAKPLMDTAQEVDESELDDNGFYKRTR